MTSNPSAQVQLCQAYATAIATKNFTSLRTLLAADVTMVFLPTSFGAPPIKSADAFVKVAQHVMEKATDLTYEIQKEQIMEDAGRVWYFAHFKGKNMFGEPFHNEIMARTRMSKDGSGRLVFTEIIEFIDVEAEKVLGKGVHD